LTILTAQRKKRSQGGRIKWVTANELLEMTESEGKRELVDGELIEMTPVGYKHGKIVMRLASKLLDFVDTNSLGAVVH
jgi:Uma2 family endonuclease